MKAKDIVPGNYYVFQYGSGERRHKVLVLSAGEKPMDSTYYGRRSGRKTPTGTEIQFEDGRTMVVNSVFVIEPWEDYEKREREKSERAAAMQRVYMNMQQLMPALEQALAGVGLNHVKVLHFAQRLTLRLYSEEELALLIGILEWYRRTFEYQPGFDLSSQSTDLAEKESSSD